MNTNAPNLLTDLDTVILNPLIDSMHLEEQDKIAFKKVIASLIIKELLLKVIQVLPESITQKMEAEFNNLDTAEAKLKYLQDVIQNQPQAQNEIKNYLEKDLPDFIEKLLHVFLEKATPQQRQEFFDRSNA